jgi:hypothetical protein
MMGWFIGLTREAWKPTKGMLHFGGIARYSLRGLSFMKSSLHSRLR